MQGVQIHRSHWVATAAAERLERNGRRMEVVLRDGRRLPVGETYKAAVRAMLAEA